MLEKKIAEVMTAMLKIQPNDYGAAAAEVHKLAREFDQKAELRRRQDLTARRNVVYRKRLRQEAEMLATYMMNGMSADQAIKSVARFAGKDPEQIECLLPRAHAMIRRDRKNDRKRQIFNMLIGRKTNAEIARAVGLSERQVKRIVKQIREDVQL